MNKITVYLRKKDFKYSKYYDCMYCPLAKVLKRIEVPNLKFIDVTTSYAYYLNINTNSIVRYRIEGEYLYENYAWDKIKSFFTWSQETIIRTINLELTND